MPVTGYGLKAQRQALELDLTTLFDELSNALYAFKTDVKRPMAAVSADIAAKQKELCKLETLQAQYNLAVKVDVEGETISLMEAVKRVGGAVKLEQAWRAVATPKKDSYAPEHQTERSFDREFAGRTVTTEDAKGHTVAAARYASAVKAAVALGNATEIELDTPRGPPQ